MIRVGICGLLGYEAADGLLRMHEEVVKCHFSRRFLEDFRELKQLPEASVERRLTGRDPVLPSLFRIFEIGEGGLFGTLWRMCEEIPGSRQSLDEGSDGVFHTGCEIDLLRVPVRQEVVEICELFDENPYEVPSSGCVISVYDEERLDELPQDCLSIIQKSVMIGKLTTERRRILLIGDRVRYLTPPARQNKDIRNRSHTADSDSGREIFAGNGI